MTDKGTQFRGDDPGVRLRMKSEERRISSQHERLDGLCRELYARLDKYGAAPVVEEFLLFVAALDAHMKIEEEVYFPALHGLRGDTAAELDARVSEHADLREQAEEVRQLLDANDGDAARMTLESLAREIEKHEQAEEDLIARITEGPVADFGHSNFD